MISFPKHSSPKQSILFLYHFTMENSYGIYFIEILYKKKFPLPNRIPAVRITFFERTVVAYTLNNNLFPKKQK